MAGFIMQQSEQTLTPPYAGRIWLLGALFLVTVPHLVRMPAWLSISCLVVFTWRLLHELRGYDLPGRLLRYLLVFIGIGSVAAFYHTIVGQQAGVALLTVMLCLKLLELHTMRDAMLALFIGYFMVIAGFLFSQSIFMGGYLFLVVLTLTAALIALNHPAGQLSDYRHYLASGGKMLLQSLPLMLLMFILFPRLSSPLWSVPEDPSTGRTGLADSIEMGTISNLVKSESVAFRVDFDGEIPPADTLYWRGPVLWKTDGRHWERIRMTPSRTIPSFKPLGGEVDYSVTMEPNRRPWLFALDLPLSLPEGLQAPVYSRPDFQLLYDHRVNNKLRYRVRSVTRYHLDQLPRWMEIAASSLPQGKNPKTVALAKRWLDQGVKKSAIVQRGYDLFRNQPFYYTRTPPRLGENPVDQFLFTTRRGFCEHYATSFVTLMRAAGIPARVVTGYQGGELNELGDYLIIRQSNAHAWAEVWLEQQGWVRIDPTTAVPRDRVDDGNDASRFQSTSARGNEASNYPALNKLYWKLRYSWDAINHTWTLWVLGFDRERQRELLRKLGLGNLSWSWLIGLMFGLLAITLTLIAAVTFLRRPAQPDPVLRLYQEFCRNLGKAGIVCRGDEGPADFARRASRDRPDLAPLIQAISEHYIRLRYTRHATEDDLGELRRLIRSMRV
jgi:transglutaminase-like putative cysteine protease